MCLTSEFHLINWKKNKQSETFYLYICVFKQKFWSDTCIIGIENHILALPMLQDSREQSQSKSRK